MPLEKREEVAREVKSTHFSLGSDKSKPIHSQMPLDHSLKIPTNSMMLTLIIQNKSNLSLRTENQTLFSQMIRTTFTQTLLMDEIMIIKN